MLALACVGSKISSVLDVVTSFFSSKKRLLTFHICWGFYLKSKLKTLSFVFAPTANITHLN